MSICYVTAFYDLKRENWSSFDRTVDQYFLYFEPFIGLFSRKNRKDQRMVLFMDKKHTDRARNLIERYGENARINVIEIDKDFLSENIPVWKTLHTEREIMQSEDFKEKVGRRIRFPEHQIPEYTLINHAKIDFVNYVINSIATAAKFFAWVDFGYFAYPKNVPNDLLDIGKLDIERVNYTLINKLDDNDKSVDHTLKYAPEKFGGFFFFGSRVVLKEYQRLYHEILENWQTKLRIADDDQHLALRCYFQKPEMFALHYTGAWHAALKHFQIEPKTTLFDTDELKKIAGSSETDLCRIMNKERSDKGSGHHNYTKLYDKMFKKGRDKPLTILEIGIGSVNPEILSNMCGVASYQPGASVRGWRKYFPNSKIYCCDIDPETMIVGQDRITSFVLDQRDLSSVTLTFYSGDLKDITFDIIIDDGLHHFPTNYAVMKILYDKLNEGGYYIIEDILDYNESLVSDFRYNRQYVTLPNPKNNVDNNLFIVWK